jgi:hypothetical protein
MHLLVLAGLVSIFSMVSSSHGLPPVSVQPAEGAEPRVEVVSSDDRSVRLHFELPELVTEDLAAEGEEFHLVSIPGGGFEGAVGAPAVPIYGRLVAVPDGAEVRVRTTVLEEEERAGIHLVPMQAGDESGFALDRRAYALEGGSGSLSVRVGEPAIFRDFRVVNLTFRPVRYDPSRRTLNVARRMSVEIEFVAGGSSSEMPTPQPSIPPSFDRLYRELILNYPGPRRAQSVTPGTYLVICQNNSSIVTTLQPLLDWRERRGLPTMLATTSETGTSSGQIKSYIQGVYNDPGISLEHVVLVGDASGTYSIPTWYESMSGYSGEGDYPYSQLAGGDALPDVHIGRLSIDSPTTLDHIVDKVIGYESTPYVADPTWFTRSCIVGDPSPSGYSVVDAGRWLALRLQDVGFAEADTIFSGPWVSRMQTALNRGDTVFGYRGWLGMSDWSNAYTYTLTNGWKMPFAVILTCDTGSFASGTSRSEGFLRAWNSGSGIPRGGIGSIGLATIGTHTRYNNCLYYGIFRGLAQEGQSTMGAALTRGCLEMYLNYYDNEPSTVQIWSHWANLMGDPAVPIWTGYPEALDVSHPSSLALGTNSVTVTVSDGPSPIEGVQVCLSKGGETHVVGFTDSLGEVELPVTTATAGDMLLTVTKHDRHPYLATIPVASVNVYVGYSASAIDDDSSGESIGNGDGVVNPGETIELPVQVENFGTETATNVTASLSSTDPYITILDGNEVFGTIPAGGTAWSTDDFGFRVGGSCPHGHVLTFDLDVRVGLEQHKSLIGLDVTSAELIASGHTVHDGGNGRLDPGETADVSVLLQNFGFMVADGVTGTLTSLSARVTVTDSIGSFGTIGAGGSGQNTGDRFTVSVDPGTYEGYLADFSLVTSFSGGMTDTVEVSLPVGNRGTNDPTGPDTYGYLAYDNTDTAYPEAPTYDWVELDPAYLGDGTEVVLGDYGTYQDKSKVVDLPFSFDYYGETYSQVTVCSNGWIAMGSTPLISYRNWTIPGAGGPNGMLAAFWDNLYQSGGSKVWEKYDSANHRWIVEWSRMLNDYNGATETFEIILYDPAYHTTDTGDGIIVYQYQTVTNYDPTNGYATVGIESPDQLDGVLYTYFNDYAPGAATLAAGRAVKFIPVREGPSGTLAGDVLNSTNGDSPIEEARVEVLGTGKVFYSGASGAYGGLIPPGTYTVTASHVSFEPDTVGGVTIQESETTVLDFHLTDIAPPAITTTTHPWTDDTTGPYPIPVSIVEYSGLAEKVLYYSAGGSPFTSLTLQSQGGNDYLAEIPGQPYTTLVRYYVYAQDGIGLESTDPPGAPAVTHSFAVAPTDTVIDDAFESASGWTVGAGDDDATTGIWIRAEPVGTTYSGYQIQPEYDHTPDPSQICFVTGNAGAGEPAGTADVDDGKTTLFSPVYDLHNYMAVTVSYWVWYSNNRGNNPGQDTWVVEVTANGTDWVALENTTESTMEAWVQRSFLLDDHIDLTDQVRFRFVASDEGAASLVEAAVDDFLISGTYAVFTGVESVPGAIVYENRLELTRPNPFRAETRITYQLARPGRVDLRVYDVAGRLVMTLVEGRVDAGRHHVVWEGRNVSGNRVASGVYFARLTTDGFTQVRRITLLR